MYGWNTPGLMGWGWLMPVIILGVVVFLLTRSRCHTTEHKAKQSPQDILDERFARGELDEEEYQTKLGSLQQRHQ